jgi:hypothetical protein
MMLFLMRRLQASAILFFLLGLSEFAGIADGDGAGGQP